jgi:hypothetical protein
MTRKTSVALIVFVVLLGGVYYLQTRPEKGERVGERPRPLPRLDVSEIRQVSITNKGKTVLLEKVVEQVKDKPKPAKAEGKGSGSGSGSGAGEPEDLPHHWEMLKPVKYKADKYSADSVIEKLENLEFGDLVTERKDKHAEYDLTGDNVIHVVVFDKKKQKMADFYLGKVLSDYTMFRVDGKAEVWQAVGSVRFAFEREVKNWRDRTIVDFKQEDARKLAVTTAGGTVTLSRPDDKGSWKVEQSPLPIDQLDDSTVTNLLTSLYSLSAFDFADGKSLEDAGLEQPVATITATLKDGKQVSLLVGGHKDEDYWVKRADAPQVFVLKKHTVESLLLRPIDFREKTVMSFKPADVVSLTLNKLKDKQSVKLTRKGDDWLGNGKKVADSSKITEALDTLSMLKAEGFARNTAAELGLDKPDWTVEVKLKDRSSYLLTVGSVDKDGLFGVTRKGLDDIFTFRKYALDRFLLEPKDYQ